MRKNAARINSLFSFFSLGFFYHPIVYRNYVEKPKTQGHKLIDSSTVAKFKRLILSFDLKFFFLEKKTPSLFRVDVAEM